MRFDCIHCRKATTKPQSVKGAFVRMLTNKDDLLYFDMDDLANFVDKPADPNKQAGIARDAKVYKPVRDAMAHTSILTSVAKNSLNITYENIKARIKKLLES